MGQEPRKGSDSPGRAKRGELNELGGKNHDIARQFAWEIAAINVHLQEIRYFWAKALGVSGPQWMILMALADLEDRKSTRLNSSHVEISYAVFCLKKKKKKKYIEK